MKSRSTHLFLLVALLLAAVRAYPCSWAPGRFHQVSALRGNVVGASIGPFQYLRWLRQSFVRKSVQLSLYQYRYPIHKIEDMPLVKTIHADGRGHFDFGDIATGHYTLVVNDGDWNSRTWFYVEVRQQVKKTVAVVIDISPNFPDCKGGHEFIVKTD